jgi:hypothetical protein
MGGPGAAEVVTGDLPPAVGLGGASGSLVGLKLLAIGTCFALSPWGSTDDDQFMFYLPPVTLILWERR